MSLLQSIILGIIQGLTEYLPVSSSAHLVLVPYVLGWSFPKDQAFVFDVLVQLPSVLAVIIYFWRDLAAIIVAWLRGLFQRRPFADPMARLGWLLILATLPAGLIGLFLKSAVENAFSEPRLAAFFLWITAALLVLGERIGRRTRDMQSLTWLDALVIGLFQAISIFPGISRSGSTITGGMVRNLERPAAARFAFLMSIPIMLAAGLLAGLDIVRTPGLGGMLPAFLPGMLASLIVSYIAIRWLLRYISNHSLYVFAVYCVVIGAGVLVFSLF